MLHAPLRRLAPLTALTLALAACATPPPSRPPVPGNFTPGRVAYAPPADVVYPGHPPASLAGAIYRCRGRVSNAGPTGGDGEALSYLPFVHTPAGPVMVAPVDQPACLSSGFGWRSSASGGGRNHKGLDFAPRGGKRVYAAADGVVIGSGRSGGYGYLVRIDHGNGVETRYAHLNPDYPMPRVGTRVHTGQPIATMGSTGLSTGVHLHYEVRIRGEAVNPFVLPGLG